MSQNLVRKTNYQHFFLILLIVALTVIIGIKSNWEYKIIVPIILIIIIYQLVVPKYYNAIYIDNKNISFEHRGLTKETIIIPVSDIDKSIIHYCEGRYDSSWIYIVDKHDRKGTFHFSCNITQFEQIENSFLNASINYIRKYHTVNDLKDSYRS